MAYNKHRRPARPRPPVNPFADAVDWSELPAATPLADLRRVREMMRQHSNPPLLILPPEVVRALEGEADGRADGA